jgi:hypothetical protein
MTVLVYGPSGAFDTFTVLSVTGAVGQLKANRPGGSLSTTYGAGLPVAEVVQFTYYLKTAPTGDNQLMRYDGTVNAGVPVVDHVVDLRFEYLGEPRPPRVIRPVTEPDGPWTTYGPRPPLPYTDNCIFAFDSAIGAYLSTLGNLDSEAALVPLTATELSDGDIWCPNAADPRRYDADLLRIRAVTVTARVQSAIPSFRGPAGPLFWNAGTSTHAARLLPDQEVRFQASIRNVGMTR